MRNTGSDTAADLGRAKRLKALTLLCVVSTGVLFLIDDGLGLFNGGGLFSVVAGWRAVHHGTASVDVDQAGLRTIFAVAIAALLFAVVALLDLDPDRKAVQAGVILSLVAGAFVADVLWDGPLVTKLMAARGYVRCPALDHSAGAGKGQVWFHNYELGQERCPPAGGEDRP